MIEVEDLHMHFGGIHAVDGVSLSIEGGRITGLIGPNGGGKSTLLMLIAGLIRPSAGRVEVSRLSSPKSTILERVTVKR